MSPIIKKGLNAASQRYLTLRLVTLTSADYNFNTKESTILVAPLIPLISTLGADVVILKVQTGG